MICDRKASTSPTHFLSGFPLTKACLDIYRETNTFISSYIIALDIIPVYQSLLSQNSTVFWETILGNSLSIKNYIMFWTDSIAAGRITGKLARDNMQEGLPQEWESMDSSCWPGWLINCIQQCRRYLNTAKTKNNKAGQSHMALVDGLL